MNIRQVVHIKLILKRAMFADQLEDKKFAEHCKKKFLRGKDENNT